LFIQLYIAKVPIGSGSGENFPDPTINARIRIRNPAFLCSSRRTSVASRVSETSLNSQILPAITLDPARLLARRRAHQDPESAAGVRRKPEFRYVIPEPGRSIDFGQPALTAGILPGDPGYRWL